MNHFKGFSRQFFLLCRGGKPFTLLGKRFTKKATLIQKRNAGVAESLLTFRSKALGKTLPPIHVIMQGWQSGLMRKPGKGLFLERKALGKEALLRKACLASQLVSFGAREFKSRPLRAEQPAELCKKAIADAIAWLRQKKVFRISSPACMCIQCH